MQNTLYYGDNLRILREYIPMDQEQVDHVNEITLCFDEVQGLWEAESRRLKARIEELENR